MFSALVNQYGLVALGLSIVLESAGLPLPGETMLLLAAAAAAQGVLPIGAVIAVAAVAAITGDSLGYWIGQRYGLALLTRYGRWLRITPAHLEQAQAFFQRHGPKTIFLGRFVAVLRVLTALLAGVSRMRYRVFLAYNVLGGMVWAAVIGFLGFQFGHQLPVVEYALRQAGWVTAGLAVVACWGSWRGVGSCAIRERCAHVSTRPWSGLSIAVSRAGWMRCVAGSRSGRTWASIPASDSLSASCRCSPLPRLPIARWGTKHWR